MAIKPDLNEVFAALNERLAQADISLEIVIAGGYALQYHDLRGTQDIDAFYHDDDLIREMIFSVGEKFGINTENESWLNNSVSSMNRVPPTNICETIFSFSNLTVLMPPLSYILGMKTESMRGRDIQDIGAIIKYLGIKDPFALLKQLSGYGFSPDISIIMEGFEIAYGTDWLEEFYREHQEEVNRLM